ncbi:MAG: D-glycerate dehydrogenase [Nitrospirae bacterium]|nr:MAG: D-glycerate dehydrogenase [Nitrospirota bacterium]
MKHLGTFSASSSRTFRILVTRRLPLPAMERLQAHAALVLWDRDTVAPRDWLEAYSAEVDAILCLLTDRIDAALLARAPRLRVVSTMAVGYDHIDIQACTARGVPVGYTPGVLTDTTADFAFALLLAAARRLPEALKYVEQGRWTTWSPTLLLGRDLHGATLGIVGFGRIGQAVARRATGFGMRILAYRASTSSHQIESVEFVDFPTLLRESDFVSLHVPLTEQTYHMIGTRELNLMKSTAILVNTARGGVVDHAALSAALANGTIGYAALDVTEPEPLPADDPLLQLPNCLIVPHIASASVATRTKMALLAVENVLAGIKGERLPQCVNPEVYHAR